jgi:hypothetical protein
LIGVEHGAGARPERGINRENTHALMAHPT